MEEESNTKLLGKIFVIVFIVIFILILLTLVEYVFSVNSHQYTLPVSTTKYVDYSYKDLDNAQKLDYNTKLLDKNFIIPLNNALDNHYSYSNIDLIQSEESKFKYLYTFYTLKDNPTTITFDKINEYSTKIFDTTLDENNFSKYLQDGVYKYDINYANPPYCLKAIKQKKSGKKLMVMLNLIEYNSPICAANYLDYNDTSVAFKAILTVTKNGDNYYINSFVITEIEGE